MSNADLILHTVRLRIVQAFLGGRVLTTTQLAAELDDVPPASLYRHVAKLAEAGVLTVTAERRVRGTVERTYELQVKAARIGPDEVAEMTVEDYRRGLLAFVAGMLSDFDKWTSRSDDIIPGLDHMGYRMGALWLTDEELTELAQEIGKLVAARMPVPAGPGRKRYILRGAWQPE
jgi:DNA-binding transcriptional ArsR family regulator